MGPVLLIEYVIPMSKSGADATGQVGPRKEKISFSSCEELPEEFMSQMKAIIGDGKARVGVSIDIAVKDFGTGAGAMCTVSLTCDQDENAVSLAGQLAGHYALYIAGMERQKAVDYLQQLQLQTAQKPAY